MKHFLYFLGGLSLGCFLGVKYSEKHFESLTRKEIEEVRQHFKARIQEIEAEHDEVVKQNNKVIKQQAKNTVRPPKSRRRPKRARFPFSITTTEWVTSDRRPTWLRSTFGLRFRRCPF
jgi:hypothetical protein